MTSPVVTELPRHLEAVSRDTFLDGYDESAAGPGAGAPARGLGRRAVSSGSVWPPSEGRSAATSSATCLASASQ